MEDQWKGWIFIVGWLLLMGASGSLSEKPPAFLKTVRGTAVFTAYNSLPEQTDGDPWTTAAGTRCRFGVVAANFLPLGTQLTIEGFGKTMFRVEDRTHPRYRHRIDIWMPTKRQAIHFGKKSLRFAVVRHGNLPRMANHR